MKWWRDLLVHFGQTPPPTEDATLLEQAEMVRHALKDADVRITITSKNKRAHDALRRLEGHARR